MSNYKAWLVLLLGFASIGVIALVTADFTAKPHMSELSCGKCHLVDPIVSPSQARKLVASQEVICRSCHAKALQMSHPSGVIPQMKLPVEYPADWKGELTCSSCHDVHGTTLGLLRGNKRGEALCLSCHDSNFFQQMKDNGTSLRQTGHLSMGVASVGQVEIDALSLQCLSCHENKSDAMGVRMGQNGVLYHNSGEANHPIGVRYPAYANISNLRPKSDLPKVILLPDGKLGCVSCHQVYKKEHGKLVMSNQGSALCLQCHNL